MLTGCVGSTGRAVGLMQDIVIYILDSAPEAVQALCGEVCAALSMELERYKAPLLVLAQEGDTPARDAFLLGKWAFLQCCKIVRNAAKWRDVVSPLALQVTLMSSALISPAPCGCASVRWVGLGWSLGAEPGARSEDKPAVADGAARLPGAPACLLQSVTACPLGAFRT